MKDALPSDILCSVSEQLVGDSTTLASASLVSKTWHSLALPYLLRKLDLSLHNRGRLPQHDHMFRKEVYADHAIHDSSELVPRQRAFVRLITENPEYARYTHIFAWTLIWLDLDNEEDSLTGTDYHTWNVFSRLVNVSSLDLASLHEITEVPYVRQNPVILFPAVTKLRLVGWMHRGLVTAILSALNPSRLQTIDFDCLMDEGAWTNGDPISCEKIEEYTRSVRNGGEQDIVSFSEDAYVEQYQGKRCIFPGLMWMPLRELSATPLDSLTSLRIRLPPFTWDLDLRG